MCYAVTHFLVPAIIVALFRDYYLSKKEKRIFPLHYVLLAGLAGLFMDFDWLSYHFLKIVGVNLGFVYFDFTHNIFLPLIFLVLGFIFIGARNKQLGKHKLKLSTIFLVISFALFTHLILDAIFEGFVIPFYPLTRFEFGLNVAGFLPLEIQTVAETLLDAVLLVFWMIWLETKHKISDFI